MNSKDLSLLSKKLLSLVLAVVLSFGLISLPVGAAGDDDDNGVGNAFSELTGASLLGTSEGYTFYTGFDDQFYISENSRLKLEYADGYSETLHIESGAFIEDENPKRMTLNSRYGKASIELKLDDESGKVSAQYIVDRAGEGAVEPDIYDKTLDLGIRKTVPLDSMDVLRKGKITIDSDSASMKYFRIDPSVMLAGEDKAVLHSYTTGNEDTEIILYRFYEYDGWGYWKCDDDSGNDGNASLYYGLDNSTQYILAVRSFENSTVLVTDLITEDSSGISEISDMGSVYYPQFDQGIYDIQYKWNNGTTETIQGIANRSPLDVWFSTHYFYNDNDEEYEEYYIAGNDDLIITQDENPILPIKLKSENVVIYTDFSKVPAYNLGDSITIPANSFQVYCINSLPEYISLSFNQYMSMKLYGEEDSQYIDNWTDDDYEDFAYNVPVNCAIDGELVNKKCLIGFYNYSDQAVTGTISQADGAGNIVVTAQSVTLNTNSLSLNPGASQPLTATVLPANASDKTVTWTSSNPAVATVGTNGVVTAVAAGTAAITASTSNGKTAVCNVTVAAPAAAPAPTAQPAPTPAASAPKVGSTATVSGQKYKITSSKAVTFTKAKKGKKATVPATVKIKGKKYKVSGIAKNAFKGTKTVTVVVKSKNLTKKNIKASLKGSKVKTIVVKVGKAKVNKQYVKKYKKIFTKKIAGKKVTVK